MRSLIEKNLEDHKNTLQNVIEHNIEDIEKVCTEVVAALKNGNKIMLCGNGGSAADAQHLAAELTGRFVKERGPLPGLAFTTDTSALTAVGNDYGFEYVFARQAFALSQEGDILIGISTSGNSQNVINAFEEAKKKGAKTVALVGKDGGTMKEVADMSIVVNDPVIARVQEMHITIGHIICSAIDEAYDEE